MKNKKKLVLFADYKSVFTSERGKNVLKDLMKRSSFISSSHVPGDPYTSAYNEGARGVVVHILRVLKMDLNKMEEFLINQDEGDLDE